MLKVTSNPPVLVTPEMLEAGVKVLHANARILADDEGQLASLVKQIYRAMAWVKPPGA